MIIQEAVKVLEIEGKSILNLTTKINHNFEKMVNIICSSTGKVIISGIGKSGLIGRKIVATLTSTGTSAIFLHPVEAMHGDLGMVSNNDVFIGISNSGETQELNILLPSIKEIGCKMIAFTGNINSSMADYCSIIIDTGVKEEACPLGLAPTSSTTAQLAMGDALAVVLIKKKNFQKKDFQKSHPGGALGQRLSCKVSEIMLNNYSLIPSVLSGTLMTEAITQMDKFKLGIILVLEKKSKLIGVITDGDIRHFIAEKIFNFNEITAEKIMTKNPHTIYAKSFLYDALNIMEKHQITVLPVIDKNNILQGILHLHDILGKGAFKFNA